MQARELEPPGELDSIENELQPESELLIERHAS